MIVVGIVTRFVVWLSAYGVPEADEAVGGLMAKHVLDGDLSTFYWGQAYGGPLETWLAAPVVAIFGETWVGLRLIPVMLCALTAITIWRVGLRTIGPYGAITAAAVYWVFPSYLIWKSIHFHIFYASGMLLGALALLLVLRLHERPTRRDAAVLGLVVGVGLWQSFQLLTIVPIAIGWLIVRKRDVVRLIPAAIPGALVGLIPFLVYNIRNSWASLDIGQIGVQSTYFSRIETFFTNTLPMGLDVRAPCTLHWFLWKPAGLAIYAVLIGGFLVLAWKARRRNREVVVAVIAGFPAIYAINQLTGTYTNPGYVLILLPVLVVALCAFITRPLQGLWTMGATLLLVAGSFVDLHAAEVDGDPPTNCIGPGSYLPRDFGPLIRTLDQLHITRVYASYWIAYRIDYETGERIIAAEGRPNALRVNAAGGVIPKPNDDSLNPRHPEYNKILRRTPRAPWVIDKSFEVGPIDFTAFSGAGYESVDVGEFTVYYATRPDTR
jgi:4-amino-4-deoxy-L-arabinose transferase-like glycosyltransferase